LEFECGCRPLSLIDCNVGGESFLEKDAPHHATWTKLAKTVTKVKVAHDAGRSPNIAAISNDEVERHLNALRKAVAGSENLMAYPFEAVKAYATLCEICDAVREVFGSYEEAAIT
jgi:methylmalonyl-CoA mutase N-terminal domain/subunit